MGCVCISTDSLFLGFWFSLFQILNDYLWVDLTLFSPALSIYVRTTQQAEKSWTFWMLFFWLVFLLTSVCVYGGGLVMWSAIVWCQLVLIPFFSPVCYSVVPSKPCGLVLLSLCVCVYVGWSQLDLTAVSCQSSTDMSPLVRSLSTTHQIWVDFVRRFR